MATPDACADELRRAVKDLKLVGAMIHGTTRGPLPRPPELRRPARGGRRARRADLHPPERADRTDVQKPTTPDLPEGADRVLVTAGWGWHSEVAIHILRMVLAGTFDKHPKLKMIIGHMGEMLPVMLARLDEVSAPPTSAISSGCRARPSSSRSGSPPAASSPSRRSSPRCRPSASTASCSPSTIRSRRTPRAASSLTRSRWRPADMAKLCHGNADALLKLKA